VRASEWIVVAAVSLAFVPALLALEDVWSERFFYSHGYLVPLVAGAIAWSERDALRGLAARRAPGALGGLALCLAGYGLGLGLGSTSLQGLALVGAVAATVWFLRGPAWVRHLAFPLVFLIFMVPVPDAWLTPAILKLQLWVSSGAVALLQGLGMAVLRVGNVIELPGGDSLFVAEACSGITSVVTLAPLAVLLARYLDTTWPHRVLLVAAVVPVAMLSNLGRVVGTVAAARRAGAEAVTSGFFHEAAGLGVYAVACLGLVGLGMLLRRDPAEDPAAGA